ncbi:MAG: hypothetical protein IJ655_04425 [Lachnospiraceae bacterium]|nr:hypothetical protein [Lachnospiraceae bacterium]
MGEIAVYNMRLKISILIVLFCVFTGTVSGCSSSEKKSKSSISSKDIQEMEKNKIENGDVPEDMYGDMFVSVSGAHVDYCDSYYDKSLGLYGFTVTNNGDKTLKTIILVIVYKDSSGNDVSEESVCVLDRFDDPLKPGHSFSIDSDKFIELSEPPPNAVIKSWRIDSIEVLYE